MSIDWTKIHHFRRAEFENPECLRWEMLEKLDRLRELCGFPFVITSTCRSPEHNKAIGGAPNSSHCRADDGMYSGVDFTVDGGSISPGQLFMIVKHAHEVGFRRIGLYSDMRHVHLDLEGRLNQDVLWID